MPAPTPASLYQRAMGPAFGRLAPALARFHSLSGRHRLRGKVVVEAPAGAMGRLLAWALGAPLRPVQGDIVFELDATPGAEVWTRCFPARTMRSTLRESGGRVVEHLGAARLGFVLDEQQGRLVMRLQHLHFLGIPCPAWLRPRVVAEETGRGDTLHFHVQATVPWVGRVVHYRGHLVVPATEGLPP
ncbi:MULTISPECIES: DUF4166 domain-containing protein [unclassified Acidovorax]|uniref:DUF4166 domain-containing protein n=1 Tax=unclassified Acidovorax TaxID=2684926 RepID=UPI001C44F07A|nr:MULTISPECIES: DUF4166 domain-containing protein [unclassified Acidovorax]MBV7428121.1 DUF4166 domain-containing protein [Acidovorax sp. sif0732]MBV7449378.1 DUF4166 domain-containing protein [Acidovorax sp. sif0715]